MTVIGLHTRLRSELDAVARLIGVDSDVLLAYVRGDDAELSEHVQELIETARATDERVANSSIWNE